MKVAIIIGGNLQRTGTIVSYQPDGAIVQDDKTKFLSKVSYTYIQVIEDFIIKPMNSDMSQGV